VLLASIPSPTRSVWHLGPVPIRAYALCILLGVLLAVWLTDRRLRARGGPAGAVVDVAVWAVPAGIIGARIYHVITSPDAYFGEGGHPLDALRIWSGGLGIWGAIAGGAIGAWIACRLRGIPLRVLADCAAPGIVFAQAIGRFGNYFNNELYGKETTLPWGLRINAMGLDGQADGQLPGTFHPTFLYESLWCLGVGVLLLVVDRHWKLGRGRLFALYGMAYTVGRAWIEYLRIDEAHEFWGLRLNEWTCLVVFLGALAYFLLVKGPREELEAEPDDETAGTTSEKADPDSDVDEAAAAGSALAGSSDTTESEGAAKADVGAAKSDAGAAEPDGGADQTAGTEPSQPAASASPAD
jgi:prolipoprotein diacylglyceryl transferase